MKYFFILIIFFSSACSLNKNSTYWKADSIKKSLDGKKLSEILKKTTDFKKMTFDEFSLFLKDYTDKSDYPDINN